MDMIEAVTLSEEQESSARKWVYNNSALIIAGLAFACAGAMLVLLILSF